ncbi:hypothetical protein [Ruegeria sp. AU67]|uniref:hypothetical protein n=1 Tax=Ruegeria sp. AU67 TaxID=2108530 RepID=UPI00135A63F4|nr:hypothetical protein [Ruegeria sp. AU67]
MQRIYTFSVHSAKRKQTVADIKAGNRTNKFVQTTAVNRSEAAVAQAGGISHL